MSFEKNLDMRVPKDHPRYLSLTHRHKIIQGLKNLIVSEAGLIAHGRGECFDYILGERTNNYARNTIKAAVALLLLAKKPVISVNGNAAALCPNELVELSKLINAKLEINIFYQKKGRLNAIKNKLIDSGAEEILGIDVNRLVEIEEISSNRRKVDPDGIKIADIVFIPLEDGDRTEALKKLGKKVIAVDLNPLSRTSVWADITIVDNIVRALPLMIQITKKLKELSTLELKKLVDGFNNKKNLKNALNLIIKYIEEQKINAFKNLKD